MRPFERVLLYIGAPKTGTTSIQNLLRRNRAALLEQGVLVPHAGQAGTGQHIDLPAIVLSGESRADLDRHFDFNRLTAAERRARFLADLTEEIADAPKGHTLLLFSEHMFYSDPAEIVAYRDLLSRHADRLECLMYLRRQDRWLASLSVQVRKTDPNWSLALLPGDAADFARRVRAWDEGADHCQVRRFEAEFLSGGDLVQDFLAATGIDARGLQINEVRANPSLLQEQLELMDALNDRIAALPASRRVHLRQGFVPFCTDVAGGTPIEFPRAAAESVFAAHGDINGWLHDRHDPNGPPLFFDERFDEYPHLARNDARYDTGALADIEVAIGGEKATGGSPSAGRRGRIEAIAAAWIARRRSAEGGLTPYATRAAGSTWGR